MNKEWKPLSLFFVEYPIGDPFGFLLAWLSMFPMFIGVAFVTLIIFRRDLHTFCYFVGVLGNEGVNIFLKHFLKHKRPDRPGRYPMHSYAMPSDHSQFIWFVTTYFLLFLFVRLHKNCSVVDDIWRYLVAISSCLISVLVCYSRIYLGYHTWDQVLWGASIGSCLGCLWFLMVHYVLTAFFPLIANTSIGEFLMLRDSTLIPNILWFEYIYTKNEARVRARKNHSGKHC